MIGKLLRLRRTHQLAQAINRCDVEHVLDLLNKGVDLTHFKARYSDPIPHAPEHTSSMDDVLAWAAMCHLPAAGFEALLRAGARQSERAWLIAATHGQAKGAGPWPEAGEVAELLSPEAFQQRALQAVTTAARSDQPRARL